MIKFIGIALATAFAVCAGGYLVSLNAGCAAIKADEPIIAADIAKAAKAADFACAADAVASVALVSTPVAGVLAAVHAACPEIQLVDSEITAFAAKLSTHPAAKATDAGPG